MAKSIEYGTRAKRPLTRSVLSDETHDAILWLLLNHQIMPGQHINIDALARDLGVSQTPVREALARLESENLVDKQPLKGYKATPLLPPVQVEALYDYRALLEPWAAGQAALLHTEAEGAELAAELTQARTIDPEDFDAAHALVSAHDTRFHELVGRMSHNEYLQEAYERTHFHLHMYRLFEARKLHQSEAPKGANINESLFAGYWRPDVGFLTVHGHAAIVEAILARDATAAEDLMRAHVLGSRAANVKAAVLLSNT